jgi:hypothetical protein
MRKILDRELGFFVVVAAISIICALLLIAFVVRGQIF